VEDRPRACDYVIPRDERSGSATDAKVPEYMDYLLSEKDANVTNQVAMHGGLAWLDTECRKRFQKAFIDASDGQRRQVLDDIAYPAKAKPEMSYGVAFFNRFRDMTASGFFSSAEGWKDVRYIGNVFNPGYDGCPPAALPEARRQLRLDANARQPAGEVNGSGDSKASRRLGVAFVGSGFNARFHLQAFRAVRDADVLGIWSPNKKNAASAAELARKLDVGAAKSYASIGDMVADPAVDAIWLTGPNHARIENVEEIVNAVERGRGTLRGIACEKPLARNVAEAKRVIELVKRTGIAQGYLENQVFAPQVEAGRERLWARGAATTGRPYLARAAEEHSGPHAPWFWREICKAAACSTT